MTQQLTKPQPPQIYVMRAPPPSKVEFAIGVVSVSLGYWLTVYAIAHELGVF